MTGASSGHPHASSRPDARALVAFGAVALLAVASVALPPYTGSTLATAEIVAAVVLLGLMLGLQTLVTRAPHRRWYDPVPAFLSFAVFVLLRDGSGGSDSGLVPLLGLPILWLALFGTRRDLQVAAGLTLLTFVVPVVLVGGPTYPADQWHHGVLWSALALFVAPMVQTVVSDLVVAQARQAEAAARVHGLMRGATLSSMVATDVEGRITDFSAGAERLSGYRSDQVAGRQYATLLHVRDEVERATVELAAGGGFDTFAELARLHSPSRIWTYVRADGSQASVRLAVTELRDDAGALTGYLTVAIDATAAVETLRRLESAEERWRTLLDHLPDTTVLVLDEHARIEACAGAGAMAQGLRGAVGKAISEVSRSENSVVVEELARFAAITRRTGRADMPSTATGREQEVMVTPLPNPGGDHPLALLLARDVSRDRAQQRALEAARDQAERIFVEAPHGALVLDAERRVTRVNPALTRMVEREPETLVGLTLSEVRRSGAPASDLDAGTAEEPPEGRDRTAWRWLASAGGLLHLTVTVTPLTDDRSEAGERYLVNVVDDTAAHAAEQQLTHLADHDPLTGLANRRRLGAELHRHLDHCRRYGARGALLVLDLDHLKAVNDTLGHAAGDELLVSVAGVLQQTTRRSDVVARLGGDEFALLLPEADREAAVLVAQDLVDRVRDHPRARHGSRQWVTASVGLILIDEAAARDGAGRLLARADSSMYEAKKAGRDQWRELGHLAGRTGPEHAAS